MDLHGKSWKTISNISIFRKIFDEKVSSDGNFDKIKLRGMLKF